jgi:hypothetical protein
MYNIVSQFQLGQAGCVVWGRFVGLVPRKLHEKVLERLSGKEGRPADQYEH